MKDKNLPELLSPAGSFDAFRAAIEGGADAIYVGASSFNARINAKNFSDEELSEAVKLAHLYGIKVYQTVNILVHGRETDELLRMAERSANIGIDAFIVSDLGAARLIHSLLPEMPLHASTQMSIHSSAAADLLKRYGFTRIVPARELPANDISSMVRSSQMEIEIFVHGAMCVSHSGQCLFSSLVGGRSGNRGLCAQPCRLPYSSENEQVGNKYPLSLKDMSLASHVTEIIDSEVSSLKIEGRMKSPEYVLGVTKIWRRLLDERRNATQNELDELKELFSRGGFSDGYYAKQIDRKMLGIRSDEDKQASREIEKFKNIQRKIPLSMKIELSEGKPTLLSLEAKGVSVTVTGAEPQRAINAPLDNESLRKQLSKLGDTVFYLDGFEAEINGRLILPLSLLNSLRREGVSALGNAIQDKKATVLGEVKPSIPKSSPKERKVARFWNMEQITQDAQEFFDVILLPLDKYAEIPFGINAADGFFMPTVCFDSEVNELRSLLKKSKMNEPRFAVVSNLGQIELVKELLPNTELIADFRFNVANDESIAFFEELEFSSVVLSAELTLPQIRDLHGAKAVMVYGRIPLMTLEKCVIKELYGEKRACAVCDRGKAQMKDRRGIIFPVLREKAHRNIIFNSLPTDMSDRQEELRCAGALDMHFLFTVETPDEVCEIIDDFKNSRAPRKTVRRI